MRLTLALAVLLLGSGCGGSGDTDRGSGDAGGSGDEASSELLPCAEIWVLGEKLPEDYIACDNGVEGYHPEAGYWHCSDGTEVWQEGESKYFASRGTPIRADEDGALHARLESCGALDGVS
jgi:hypothetical protein